MSWFSETFSDGLTSLKGQITKITKEVLADEESGDPTESDSKTQELEELCKSKDLELLNLREEFNKLHNQYKSQIEFLKSENQNLKLGTHTTKNDEKTLLQVQEYNQLKNELIELKEERNHLNFCLDELQAEHQANLSEVIAVRDKYKEDFELLKKEYNYIKEKLDELLKNQKTNLTDSKIESQEDNLNFINTKIKNDEKESSTALEIEKDCCEDLKNELEKLLSDIEVLSEDKKKCEEDIKLFRYENESLKNELNEKDKQCKEFKDKLDKLVKENEDVVRKFHSMQKLELELVDIKKQYLEAENRMKDLLKMFNVVVDEDLKEKNFLNLMNLLEDKWRGYQKEKEQALEDIKFIALDLESEYKKLKEEKEKLNCEMKSSSDNWRGAEKKYIEDISDLKTALLEMKTQQQNCISQSQTDDMKRLEQEVAHFKSLAQTKSNEVIECLESKNNLEQELYVLKSLIAKVEQELSETTKQKQMLIEKLKVLSDTEQEISFQKHGLEEKVKIAECHNLSLNQINSHMKTKINELEKEVEDLKAENVKTHTLKTELEKVCSEKKELENVCSTFQKGNLHLQNELEHLKAQLIIKETNLAELTTANSRFEEEKNKFQNQIKELESTIKEIQKWKNASIDLEIQRQELIKEKEEIEHECTRLKSELELLAVKDNDILQLKQANVNLIDSCNKLHYELETKVQAELLQISKLRDFESKYHKQLEIISELEEENCELKSRIHKFQEQMKEQIINSNSQQINKDDIQQHRRSRSAIDFESVPVFETKNSDSENININILQLQQQILQEQAKYRLLQQQFQEISDKESSARKEFERLKQHLIEVEDHYTEEAVENEKVINDLKSKVIAAEEQLKNSSTLYTSAKVRDNQHLESLQSQVRMVSVQRDDLQSKLSAAEDEVQKHKASLMSLQIVLEQFQQDKDREIEGVAVKYEKQLQMAQNQFQEFQMEIEGLKKQLSDAKNGLKAASRLGEQLEKKTQQVFQLEDHISQISCKVSELEASLATVNQLNSGKVDKSLMKNLVVGYILAPNGDRKSQALRIMASVLDFDQDERNKMAVDSTNSGWLSSILHPKPGTSNNQSLSEAFIRFLENESRPQPQLKLLPESETNKSKLPSNNSNVKASGVFSELMLPTFNSSQESESSVILQNVLKDS